MLYLPAGWFHEVTSSNMPGSHTHIAFNYWFHPPSEENFDQPYNSPYWERNFSGLAADLGSDSQPPTKRRRLSKDESKVCQTDQILEEE